MGMLMYFIIEIIVEKTFGIENCNFACQSKNGYNQYDPKKEKKKILTMEAQA